MLENIVNTLDSIRFADDESDLRQLDEAVQQLAAVPEPERATQALLHVFERFPVSDGYGVFWSVLHALEWLPGYEAELIASVRRYPSVFGVLMLNRLLNAGTTEVNGINLLNLLEAIATDPQWPEAVREGARGFVEHQRQHGAV